MADFFTNLSYIMGGEDQITPEFRTMFADYNAVSAPAPSAPVAPAPAPSPAPATTQQRLPLMAAWAQMGRGLFGGLGSGNNVSIGPSTGSVTVGDAPSGGLYGGNVTYNPGTSAYESINPNAYSWDKKQGASKLAADVQRAQYQDYLNRFAPIENYAINQLRGRQTADLGYDIARANQSVMNAGMNMVGQQERAMGRYGLQYQGPTTADRNEITGGRVAAMNQARLADEQRALNLMAGGTGNGGGQ